MQANHDLIHDWKAAEMTLSNSKISKKTKNLFLQPRLIQGVLTIQTYCRRYQERFAIKFRHQSSRNHWIQFHGLHFWFKIISLNSCSFNMFLWWFYIARDHTKLMEWFNWTVMPWIVRCHDQVSRVSKLLNGAFSTRENWDQWDTWLRWWDQDEHNPYLAKYLYLLWFKSLVFLAGVRGG